MTTTTPVRRTQTARISTRTAIAADGPRASASPHAELVLQALVHKRQANEVLLRGYQLQSPTAMTFTAEWPQTHGYYAVDGERLDALLVAESLRQATIAAGHALFHVPLGWAFLMDRMVIEVADVTLVAAERSVELQVTVSDVQCRGDRLHSMTSHVRFLVGELEVATGEGYLRVLDPRVYAKLRGSVSQPAAASSLSENEPGGLPPFELVPLRCSDEATDGFAWNLHYRRSDPFYFDHDVDHVPGMLLFAIMRSAALASCAGAGRQLFGFDGEFNRFVELDESTAVRVRQTASGRSTDDVVVEIGGPAGPAARAFVRMRQSAGRSAGE